MTVSAKKKPGITSRGGSKQINKPAVFLWLNPHTFLWTEPDRSLLRSPPKKVRHPTAESVSHSSSSSSSSSSTTPSLHSHCHLLSASQNWLSRFSWSLVWPVVVIVLLRYHLSSVSYCDTHHCAAPAPVNKARAPRRPSHTTLIPTSSYGTKK